MKLTRRQLVVVTGSAAAVKVLAQSVPADTPKTPADFEKQARDSVQRNGDALAKFSIPQSVEPAFQFKA